MGRVTKQSIAIVASAIMIFASVAIAQNASTGKLSGIVSDSTGATIPSADVRLTNQATGLVRDVKTADSGLYEFPLLPPGRYRIEVSHTGFKTAVLEGITVNVTESESLPIHLIIGATSESVTVTTQPELMQTETSTMGQVVTGQQITELPLVTRDFLQILGLSAGVNMDVTNAAALGRGEESAQSSFSAQVGLVTGGGIEAHGARQEDNDFEINGIQVNDQYGGGNFQGINLAAGLPIPNPDTLAEFKVQTTQYDAEYGRNAGAQVNIVTKGGTNAFHGSLWEYFRNEDMNANDYFRNLAGEGRGLLRQNQFGGTVGGHIVPDKLYFFGSYQGTKQTNGITGGCSTANISPLLTDSNRTAAGLGALFGGQSGAYAPTRVAADGSNINPVALQILNIKNPDGTYLVPTPQTTITVNGQPQGFSAYSSPCTYSEQQLMANMDYVQSPKSVFAARFFWMNSLEKVTFSASTVPGFGADAPQKFRNASLSNTYSFNSRLINEAIFGVNDTISHATDSPNPASWASLGLISPLAQGANGFGLGIASTVIWSAIAQDFEQFDLNFVDTLSYTRGNHALRFGGGLTRENLDPGGPVLAPQAIFPSWPDFLLGLPGCAPGTFPATCNPVVPGNTTGIPLGNELVSLEFSSAGSRQYRSWNNYAFVQDDWKITNNFTLNLGLRYEHLGDMADALGRNAGFDPTLANPSCPSTCFDGFYVASNYPSNSLPTGVVRDGQFSDRNKNRYVYDPRVGFAFEENSRMVLRGGYGIYASLPNAAQLFDTGNNEPWSDTSILGGPANSAQSLQKPFPALVPPSQMPVWVPYTSSSNLSLQIIGLDFRPTMSQVYSLNQQLSISPNILLEIGYVGARAEHLFQSQGPNAAGYATPQAPIRGATTNTLENIQQRVPVQGFVPTGFEIFGSGGASWYNGLDVTLSQRETHNLQYQIAYTWAKTLDTNAPTIGSEVFGNPYQYFRSYGVVAYDRRQRVIINYAYNLPTLKSKMLASDFINGWKLTGVSTFQTGLPLNLSVTNGNVYSGFTSSTNSDYAEINCPVSQLKTKGSKAQKISDYINLSCIQPFPVVDPSGTTGYGNAPVSPIFGPAQVDFDMALVKETGFLGDRANMEFRLEAFNAFNHTQLANPGTSGSAAPPPGATEQQAAAALGPGFGPITRVSVSPRVVQLALKFRF